MTVDARLQPIVAEQPYPLLFATVSGAHLYGFPSPDSDYDLRGVHLLPPERVVGLDPGFAETQWGLFDKERPRRVKPLLYVYRVLLTGIHLVQSGAVEANLVTLNERFRLPQVPELVARKLAGPEHAALDEALALVPGTRT